MTKLYTHGCGCCVDDYEVTVLQTMEFEDGKVYIVKDVNSDKVWWVDADLGVLYGLEED